MIKNFKCNNTHQILAAARCGIPILATTEIVYYNDDRDIDVVLPPKNDSDEIIRKKLIRYYGEPNQDFNIKKRTFR